MGSARPRIVVVGAGIVGASIAYHLARRGAAVTLVEQNCPASGVTGKAFAWINVSHGVAAENLKLRAQAIADWRRLQSELGDTLRIDWNGALTWSDDPRTSETLVRNHAARGFDIRLVERREIETLEPSLLDVPDCAAFAADEGALDPVATTDALVRAAQQRGATLRLMTPVVALPTVGTRVAGIGTTNETIAADIVVLAAGIATPSLCETLGLAVPVDVSPALLLRFRAPAGLLRRIVSSPQFEIRQPTAGGMLAAEDYIDESAENGPCAIAQRTLAAIRSGLRGGDSVTLDEMTPGLRPMPRDGDPIVGFALGFQNLYIATMHAGIVLAPTVARLATTEILDNVLLADLETYRPERFAAG
jgi:glycine/D-amino acid oxidase-like deaminating enzyme